MKKRLYAIHDAKIEAFNSPFTMHTVGEALRGFVEVVNDPSTQFCKHPEDFTLFELGEYEESSGTISPYATPKPIGKAIEYKKQEQPGPKAVNLK